jgi:hypothetical protein
MSDTEEDDWDDAPEDEEEDAAVSEPEEDDDDDDDEEEEEDGSDSDEDNKLDAVEEMTGPRKKTAPKPAAVAEAPKKPAAKPRASAASAKSAKSAASAASKKSAPKKRKSAESSSDEEESDDEDDDGTEQVSKPPPKKKPSLTDANVKKEEPEQKKKLPQKGDARGEIEHLLLEANRPFGVNDVVQKLAPRYDKGVVQSMLDALERQGVLRSKAVVAQQKAYWPDQSKIKATSMADIRDMSCDVRDAKCDAKEADEDASKLERRAERLLAEPANDALDAAVAAAEKAASDLEARLKRASQAPPVKPRDMVRAVKKHNEHRGLWLKRKRAFKEVVEVIAENMDLHPKKFIQAVADAQDVETDEDAGAVLPPPDAIPVPSLK